MQELIPLIAYTGYTGIWVCICRSMRFACRRFRKVPPPSVHPYRDEGHDPALSVDLPTCVAPHCTCEHVLTWSFQPAGHAFSLTTGAFTSGPRIESDLIRLVINPNCTVTVAEPILDQKCHEDSPEDDLPNNSKSSIQDFRYIALEGIVKEGVQCSVEDSIEDCCKNRLKVCH